VNLWILPLEFSKAFELARSECVPLHDAEQQVLGLTHCESGYILASNWGLAADLATVIRYHHDPSACPTQKGLLALVCLSDLLCRMSNIGHGYVEQRQVSFLEEPAFSLLVKDCPSLQTFDWARFTFELGSYLDEVHRLVSMLYRPQ
jgi:HD-like signal output (HDOD) protein